MSPHGSIGRVVARLLLPGPPRCCARCRPKIGGLAPPRQGVGVQRLGVPLVAAIASMHVRATLFEHILVVSDRDVCEYCAQRKGLALGRELCATSCSATGRPAVWRPP